MHQLTLFDLTLHFSNATGRRATQVALQQHVGRIFSFKGTFGFLEYDLDGPKQPPPRLYFHANDVEGNVQLRPGDEVRDFTI